MSRNYIVKMTETQMNQILGILEPAALEDPLLYETLFVFDSAYLANDNTMALSEAMV